MDKQAIWWAAFFAGSIFTTTVSWFLQYVYRTMKRKKESKAKKDSQYETINIRTGDSDVPTNINGEAYNNYIKGYDLCVREVFEQHIRKNVQKWWDDYENERRKEFAPLARTISKYVRVEPLRLNGAWSTDWYAYVEQGAFKVKVRYIKPYFDVPYNMEMKITNTNITEDSNGN